jgi:alpha-1,3-rhamnosyltransferase
MTEPLVTILIPSYNHAAYIEDTIDSVLRQTYGSIELIVIDDGSADESPALLTRLAAQHGFRLELQQNQGLSRTLNRGIALANGKYVCTVGSDDILMLDKTEKQVKYLEANPQIAVCGGNQLIIDAEGVIVNRRQHFRGYTLLDFDAMFVRREAVIPASSAMIRKSVLDSEGAYDPDIKLEDLYLWLKLAARGHRIAHLNDVLIYYRKHAANSYKNVGYMVDSMTKIYAAYSAHPQYARVLNRYLVSAFLRASKQNNALALQILRKISPRYYRWNVARGLWNLLLPKRAEH